MTGRLPAGEAADDRLDVDALVTDRYLESLLVAADRHATDAPADPALDPDVRRAARVLRRDLLRIHPSFRFEERLSTRLAEAAARMRLPAAAGAEGALIPLGPTASYDRSGGPGSAALEVEDPRSPNALFGAGLPRPLLIGGALTSAALSLAGAAWVAWRRGHPTRSPMARAVRAARGARLEPPRLRLD